MIEFTSFVAGRYKIQATNPDGSIVVLADWFPNLITNGGLNFFTTTNNYLQGCHVGSGNAAPQVTDTSLQTFVAGTTTLQNNSWSRNLSPLPGEHILQRVNTYRFAAGTAAGSIREVGISQGNTSQAPLSSAPLFSRALILDSDGMPRTITVTPEQVLDVFYELFIYPPETENVYTNVDIEGELFTVTARAVSLAATGTVFNSNNNVGWIFASNTGNQNVGLNFGRVSGAPLVGRNSTQYANDPTTNISGGSGTTATALSYSANSNHRDVRIDIPLNEGNFPDGIRAIVNHTGVAIYGIGFESEDNPGKGLPKTSDKIASMTYRHSWGRK